MRRLLTALLVACWPAVAAHAQTLPPSPQSLTAQFSASCSATSCATFVLAPIGTPPTAAVTISVTGTFSGTLDFEGSVDSITYVSISVTKLSDGSSATSTTTTGQFAIGNSGFQSLRVKATTLNSGGANIWAVRGGGVPKGLSPFLTRLYTGDGTCPLPAWSFASDTDLGVYRVGANNLAFCAGSVNLLDVSGTRNLSSIPYEVAAASFFQWTGLSKLAAPSDGVITFLNAAGSGFTRVQYGGTTASFPSIKRNGAGMDFRLADDSAYAQVTGGVIDAETYFLVGGVGRITGGGDGVFRITDVAGTAFNRLNLGGDAATFPSIQRSAAGIIARLADNSANTTVTGSDFITAAGSMVAGVASGYKVARGSTAFDASNPTTVATGLTTVVSCAATLVRTTALTTGTAFVTHATPSGANVDFYAWVLAGTASTGTENFDWVCVGT